MSAYYTYDYEGYQFRMVGPHSVQVWTVRTPDQHWTGYVEVDFFSVGDFGNDDYCSIEDFKDECEAWYYDSICEV